MALDKVVKAAEAAAVKDVVSKKECIEVPYDKKRNEPVLPKVDIFLDPDKTGEADMIAAKKQDIATTYFQRSNMKKLFPELFRVLWQSTLPCFPGDLLS